MALATTLRRTAAPARAPEPMKELTIEEARKQFRAGSLDLLVAEINEQERLDAITREHSNAGNRQGTKVKNAFRSYALEHEMQSDDQVQIGEMAYRYDVSYSEKYDAAGLYKMLKDGKITDGEFLRSISVSKAEAEKAIGPHKLLQLTKVTPGKTLDLRKDKLDQPVAKPKLVRGGNRRMEPKLNTASQEAPPKRTATTKGSLKVARKLRLKR